MKGSQSSELNNGRKGDIPYYVPMPHDWYYAHPMKDFELPKGTPYLAYEDELLYYPAQWYHYSQVPL